MNKISVLLIEDHRMVRDAIRSRLSEESDIDVVGETGLAAEAGPLIEKTHPDIAVVDIRLPDMSGLDLAQSIKSNSPETKVVILTGYDFDQYVRAAARVGVDGYLLKSEPLELLVEALRQVADGGAVLPPSIAKKVIASFSAGADTKIEKAPDELTIREIEVLDLLYQGSKNSDIAGRLSISVRTVEAHVGSILGKLGAENRTEAVSIAVKRLLIQ